MSTAVANPYAAQLAGRDPKKVIAETPLELTSLVQRLGPDGLRRSLAPGKWSARAILCHLADCEIAFSFRLRQALAEPHHTIQPFDQDAWSKAYSHSALRAQKAVELFAALREWNIALLETIPAEAFSKPVSHPERGDMSFGTLIETMAGHDLNHRRQLEQIVSAV